MKQGMLFWIALLTTATGWSQATLSDSGAIISRPAAGNAETNQLGRAELTITNQAGTTFSVSELDSQMRELQRTVDQTLPMLTAFNSQLGASAGSSATKALGDALSKMLSRNRSEQTRQSPEQGSSAAGGSSVGSNLVGVLRGLLTTNTASTVSVNPTTLGLLQTLQKDLETVRANLQALNGANPLAVTNSIGLTPTGRQP